MTEKIELEDGSILEIPEVWIECIRIKHNKSLEEYWIEVGDLIGRLWEDGKVLTKFGEEPVQRYYEEWKSEEEKNESLTRAWHASECIYADLRACLMGKALEMLAKEEGKEPKGGVIAIGGEKVTVYKGSEKKEYDNLGEALESEE